MLKLCVFVSICCSIYSIDAANHDYGLSSLSARISANVNRLVAPLSHLGQDISRSVNRQLFSHNFQTKEYRDYDDSLDTLGARITENVNEQLAGLDGLGDRIAQQVDKGLAPVRALPFQVNMKNGVGGTTIAKFLPNGKTFIVKRRVKYDCSGTVSKKGECSGTLQKFDTSGQDDICYISSYSIVNDKICVSHGSLSVTVINNNMKCEGSEPTTIMPLSEYREKCKNTNSVEYTYVADPNDPDHVELPNSNPYVCKNVLENGVCRFTDNIQLQGAYSYGNNVNVVNFNSNY